jgi:hypothetical protein
MSPIHATFTAHLVLLDLITQKIFGEGYRTQSSLLCSLCGKQSLNSHYKFEIKQLIILV